MPSRSGPTLWPGATRNCPDGTADLSAGATGGVWAEAGTVATVVGSALRSAAHRNVLHRSDVRMSVSLGATSSGQCRDHYGHSATCRSSTTDVRPRRACPLTYLPIHARVLTLSRVASGRARRLGGVPVRVGLVRKDYGLRLIFPQFRQRRVINSRRTVIVRWEAQ